MDRLILFDIDATLLVTSGAGIAAMRDAGRALFNPEFTTDGLEFAGRLDPLLLVEMLELNGHEPTHANLTAFRERYGAELHALSARRGGPLGTVLPGVHEVLGRLRALGTPMGLLTGNFEETGALKLRSCGIDPAWFEPAVWGDDSPHQPPRRDHLPRVALARVKKRRGIDLPAERVTIIGDTPHDVRCARVNGCRSVGVATGKYSRQQLADAGADVVLADLGRVDAVVEVLTTGSAGGLSVARRDAAPGL
ncbi:MAG: HAD family hydrolase [Phycisphaerales bacterium]|nr:HAD family hydrolase [Phycisphaerales bacterium]